MVRSILNETIIWSQKTFSSLPWRQNRGLYTTLVSEIMLQQTTVATVMNHFLPFLMVFPRLQDLAAATEEEVLIQWKGLGYYRRARSLWQAARDIITHWDGQFPQKYEDLLKITGVGPYTASALLAIGCNQKALAVDANIERVLARIYALNSTKGAVLQREIQQKFVAGKILAQDFAQLEAQKINEALMDLGRTICRANSVNCVICPVAHSCESFRQKNPLEYPKIDKIVQSKERQKFQLQLLRVVVKKRGRLLVYQRSPGEWLSGQWEVPTFVLHSEDKELNQYPQLKKATLQQKNLSHWQEFKKFQSVITKYKISNYVLEMDEESFHHTFGKYPQEVSFRTWKPQDQESMKQENFAVSVFKMAKVLHAKNL